MDKLHLQCVELVSLDLISSPKRGSLSQSEPVPSASQMSLCDLTSLHVLPSECHLPGCATPGAGNAAKHPEPYFPIIQKEPSLVFCRVNTQVTSSYMQ